MPLVMPENVHLVQSDALSHTAGNALSFEMSRNIAHKISQKSSEFRTFYDKAISQYRKIAGKNRVVEAELKCLPCNHADSYEFNLICPYRVFSWWGHDPVGPPWIRPC